MHHVRIHLCATNHRGVAMGGYWRAPTAFEHTPNEYGHDGAGHINDLPPELAGALLTHCGFAKPEVRSN